MKQKPLWRISVATTLEAEDAVEELLGMIFNRSASSYSNVQTQTIVISVFCESKPTEIVRKEISAGLNRINNCGLKIGSGKIVITKIRREDWAESWKRHFKPIEIGGSLLVKPSWSKKNPRKNQAVVVLDPGLSFGTGQHPTTAFCLEEIVKRRNKRPTILFGSSALVREFWRLRRQSSATTRFVPLILILEAVRVARANARVNGILKKIKSFATT